MSSSADLLDCRSAVLLSIISNKIQMFSIDHWQFKNGHFNSKRKDIIESALLGPIGTTFAVMAKAKGEGHSAFHTVSREHEHVEHELLMHHRPLLIISANHDCVSANQYNAIILTSDDTIPQCFALSFVAVQKMPIFPILICP